MLLTNLKSNAKWEVKKINLPRMYAYVLETQLHSIFPELVETRTNNITPFFKINYDPDPENTCLINDLLLLQFYLQLNLKNNLHPLYPLLKDLDYLVN